MTTTKDHSWTYVLNLVVIANWLFVVVQSQVCNFWLCVGDCLARLAESRRAC